MKYSLALVLLILFANACGMELDRDKIEKKAYNAIQKHNTKKLLELTKDTAFSKLPTLKKLLVEAVKPHINEATLRSAKCYEILIETQTKSKHCKQNLKKALSEQKNSKMLNLLLPLADQHTKDSLLWTIFKLYTPTSIAGEKQYNECPKFFNIFTRKKRRELIKKVLKNGANPNATNSKGNSFCHLMATGDADNLLLLSVHAYEGNFLLQNNKKETPFHIEIVKGKKKLSSLLMPLFKETDEKLHQSILTTKNQVGMTPYELVCSMHRNFVKLAKKHAIALDSLEIAKQCSIFSDLKKLF